MSDKPLELTLSASKLKTYKSCSLFYYYNYHKKYPQSTNEGALCGGIIHIILECLLKERRRDEVAKIVKGKTLKKSKYVWLYVKQQCKKFGLKKESIEKIDKFSLVALNNDFYCEGGKIVGQEVEFDIKNESPRFRIKGYIDVLIEYGEKYIPCKDYKSQKSLFQGDEIDNNLQGLMYCLAARKLYPDRVPVTDFIMLAHPDTPQQRCAASNGKLVGFESYLEQIYAEMEQFEAKDRWSNVAANKEPPADGSWGGRLMCGFAKYSGHMKKDGSKPIFHCVYRFPYDFYALYDSSGKLLKTDLKEENLSAKEGEKIVKKSFMGCERFIKKNP